jgi:hypothetical protein
MNAIYIIESRTQYQYEPIPEGEFSSAEAAIAGMRELESNLGWRNLRVVDAAGHVIELGIGSLADDEQSV